MKEPTLRAEEIDPDSFPQSYAVVSLDAHSPPAAHPSHDTQWNSLCPQATNQQYHIVMASGSVSHVLVVPDPCRLRKIGEVQEGLPPHWVLTTMPEAKASSLLKLSDVKGLIHKATPSGYKDEIKEGHTLVYIDEVVSCDSRLLARISHLNGALLPSFSCGIKSEKILNPKGDPFS